MSETWVLGVVGFFFSLTVSCSIAPIFLLIRNFANPSLPPFSSRSLPLPFSLSLLCPGVFGNDARDTGIPPEVWRYYLLAVRPETQDSAFQWADFAAKNNAELNDNLGNFINRTLKFIHARFERRVPGAAAGTSAAPAIAALGEKLAALTEQYIAALEAQKMKEALKAAMMASKAGNLFFQETEIWKAVKEDRAAAAACISACAGVVALVAALLEPFMPSFSANALKQLALPAPLPLTDDLVGRVADVANLVPAGHEMAVEEPTPLFRKITDAEVEAFRERYAGSQADRSAAEAAAGAGAAAAGSAGKKAAAAAAAVAGAKKKDGTPAKASGDAAPEGKKAGKKAAGDAAPAAKKPSGGGGDLPVDISRVDLRVGVITRAWRHPDAER